MKEYIKYRNQYNKIIIIPHCIFLMEIIPILIVGTWISLKGITNNGIIEFDILSLTVGVLIALIPFIILMSQHTKYYNKTVYEIEKIMIKLHNTNVDYKVIKMVLSFQQLLITNKHNGHIFHYEISYKRIFKIFFAFIGLRIITLYAQSTLNL